ncbi:MAG: hypothetical protein HC763_01605 [Hydrococcus sp. CRU_1_1]|nr:hypothetical protein [Hydrococcus sp. CRU_1_1]
MLPPIFEEYSQNIHYLLRQSDKQTSQALLIHCIQGLLLQGKSRHDSGDYYEAIESYDQVISINPYISEVYRARSLSYSALGYLAEAMADLQRAMSID